MKRLPASDEAWCVSTYRSTALFERKNGTKWLKKHGDDLYMTDRNVVMPAVINNTLVWVDVITGSCYCPVTGRCKSSSVLKIDVKSIEHDHDACVEWLLSKGGEDEKIDS